MPDSPVRLIPGFALRDYSWWDSEDPLGCQGSNVGQLRTRQMPYLLYYYSVPDHFIFMII